MQWLIQAARQGFAPAQLIVGVKYVLGEGAIQDVAEAAQWRQKAAEKGLDIAPEALQILQNNQRTIAPVPSVPQPVEPKLGSLSQPIQISKEGASPSSSFLC